MITSPRLHALRSVVSIPNSGKATTLLYVVNANMLFSIIPPPQSPIVCSKDTSENVGVRQDIACNDSPRSLYHTYSVKSRGNSA